MFPGGIELLTRYRCNLLTLPLLIVFRGYSTLIFRKNCF